MKTKGPKLWEALSKALVIPAVWNLDHLGELHVFVGGLDSGASEICDLIA